MKKHGYGKYNTSPSKYREIAPIVALKNSPVKASLDEISHLYGIERPQIPEFTSNSDPIVGRNYSKNKTRQYESSSSSTSSYHSHAVQKANRATSIANSNYVSTTERSDQSSRISPLPLTNRDLR